MHLSNIYWFPTLSEEGMETTTLREENEVSEGKKK
jgi:hypothetical protein